MNSNHLHIISFDIPYPPVYGGIIDIFYKIKSLKKLGYDITLHCFQYRDKERSELLESYCKEVFYYSRKKVYQVFFNTKPYIVSSRSSDELLNNLQKDQDPILFEGLHTCFFLSHPSLKDRNKSVWMHNIEWDYYQNLSDADKNFIHKIHFSVESKKLKSFERILTHAQTIFSVNKQDAEYLSQYCTNTIFVPPFHLNEVSKQKPGLGSYILYHGSLDVVENHQAAVWLIQKVFSKLNCQSIIAGKKPKSSLVELISKYPNVKLMSDLPQNVLDELIEEAQCNVLYTFQATGLKHKLLNALYKGRWVIANDKMVANSGLESLCEIANTEEELINTINFFLSKEISLNLLQSRNDYLESHYSNNQNVQKIIPYLFSNHKIV
jgi:hypothetical protein